MVIYQKQKHPCHPCPVHDVSWLYSVSNSLQNVDRPKRLTSQKASVYLFPAKEAIPVPQGNLAGLPEKKSMQPTVNQQNHAEIACQKRCSMKLRKCTGMHWLQSATTTWPSRPMQHSAAITTHQKSTAVRPTRQNHHVTVWESNIDSRPSPQDNSIPNSSAVSFDPFGSMWIPIWCLHVPPDPSDPSISGPGCHIRMECACPQQGGFGDCSSFQGSRCWDSLGGMLDVSNHV